MGWWEGMGGCGWACRGCILPPEEDSDPFIFEPRCSHTAASSIAAQQLRTIPAKAREGEGERGARQSDSNGGQLRVSWAAGSQANAKDGAESPDDAAGGGELRNIIAIGMQRFEMSRRTPPVQPAIERLSERVINILGLKCAAYRLAPRRLRVPFVQPHGPSERTHDACFHIPFLLPRCINVAMEV